MVDSERHPITSGVVGGAGGSRKLDLKWVLFGGLLLFGLGIGYMALVPEPDASRSFVPGLVVAGIGMGSVWTPLFGLATQDMAQSRAGVAAGVLDTMQEFGTVLATAVLGAVLAAGAVLFVNGGKPAPHPVAPSDADGLAVPASNPA